MADNATLSFTVAGVTPTQLEILVKNSGAEPLAKALMIELKIPIYLVSKQIKDAVERADKRNQNERTTASKESLANIVTAATGWSTWAATERTESLAVVRLYNDLNQTGTKVTPAAFTAGAEFKLTIPLTPLDKPVQVEVPYSYRYPNEGRSGIQTDGKLKMTSSGSTTKSKVTLTTTHPSPTAIPAGTKLSIDWEVENGISATLYGPLPNGISQMQFSSDEAATNKIRKGSIELYAVGAATYVLQAVVPGATPQSDEMVVRTLQLSVKSADNYSYLAVRPPKVMPHGTLEVDWAVWGIEKTWLSVGNDYAIELNLTEQDVNQAFQGSGIWRVIAPQAAGTVSALLEIQVEKKREHSKTVQFIVAAWQHDTVSFSGKPVGLAVKAPKLALLTTDALLLAEVGFADSGPFDLDFKRVAIENAKAQLAVAATDTGFVVLQQTNKDGLQVVRYLDNGTRDGLPVDLPDTVQQLVRHPHKTFNVTAFRKRIYVVAEAVGENGYRRVFSLPNAAKPQIQREPLLEALHGYRLLVFDSALFAVSQGTGRMFRFRQDENGKLEQPREAAKAVKDGRSMIQRGLMIPVGRVLVVLCPSSIPLIDTLDVTGMLMYLVLKRPKAKMAQDLVYNPQQDQWIPCGRGLEVQDTSVAAFRCSASRRLYVVDADGKAHSLAGAEEHLFVPQFIAGLSSQDLPPYFGTRKHTIKNDTGIHFEQMTDVYRKAGLDDFTAHGMAELKSAPREFPNRNTETFEFRCNEANPGAMTVRYLAVVPEGVAHDFMLEIHFSPDHSSIVSVIKRLAIDEQGMVSTAEVPGTMVNHDPAKAIVLPPATSLTNGVKLTITSLSNYLFALRRPLETITREFSNEERLRNPIEISYKTPLFTIFVTDAGELRFDVDFALPDGIEISPRSTNQTKRIRIDPEKAGKFKIESILFKGPNEYECAIRYRETKDLEALYVGDGVASNDGKSIYLPVANPENPSQPQLRQIDTGALVPIASLGFQGKDIFSVPNSIALLKDRLVAMLEDKNVAILDHSLKVKYYETLSGVTAVPVLAGSRGENSIGFLCMKEERSKYSYFYSRKHIDQDRLINDGDYSLDSIQSAGPQNRIPGIPAWLSDSNCAPMVVKLDAKMAAICIKGGLMTIDTRRDFEANVIRIESAERPEAIMYAQNGQIFCAHSHVNNQSLLVTRIGFTTSEPNKSVSLPLPVINMTTDTRQMEVPALKTKDTRAVSMLEPAVGAICVSHGKSIYLIKKEDMSVEASVTVDLPCRLIRVKHEWPPHGKHPIFGGAAPCWIVHAIGATYTGSGGKPQSRWKTELYKLGFNKPGER